MLGIIAATIAVMIPEERQVHLLGTIAVMIPEERLSICLACVGHALDFAAVSRRDKSIAEGAFGKGLVID